MTAITNQKVEQRAKCHDAFFRMYDAESAKMQHFIVEGLVEYTLLKMTLPEINGWLEKLQAVKIHKPRKEKRP